MSLSPTASSSNGTESVSKKRRTGGSTDTNMNVESPAQQSPGHIPKRGARACTNCRRGKNRCEGEVKYPVYLSVPLFAHRGPQPRPGPALCTSRRLADDAWPVVPYVYSKSPKRKTLKLYPVQVSSKHHSFFFARKCHHLVPLTIPPGASHGSKANIW